MNKNKKKVNFVAHLKEQYKLENKTYIAKENSFTSTNHVTYNNIFIINYIPEIKSLNLIYLPHNTVHFTINNVEQNINNEYNINFDTLAVNGFDGVVGPIANACINNLPNIPIWRCDILEKRAYLLYNLGLPKTISFRKKDINPVIQFSKLNISISRTTHIISFNRYLNGKNPLLFFIKLRDSVAIDDGRMEGYKSMKEIPDNLEISFDSLKINNMEYKQHLWIMDFDQENLNGGRNQKSPLKTKKFATMPNGHVYRLYYFNKKWWVKARVKAHVGVPHIKGNAGNTRFVHVVKA